MIVTATTGSLFGYPTDKHPAFEHITTQHGLPHNNIISILQDKHGFIWVATKSGLSRYDGYSFLAFQSTTTTSLYISDNYIMDMCLDSIGNLWIATLSGGVNRIDTRTGSTTVFSRNTGAEPRLQDNKTTSISCDTDGSIWVGTWSGVSKFSAKKQTFDNYSLPKTPKPDHVFSIYIDADIIWISTETVLYHFNKQSTKWSIWKDLATVVIFHKDNNGFLWLGGSFGLRRYDYRTQTLTSLNNIIAGFLPRKASLYITALESDHYGALWIGTINHGVFRFFSQENDRNGVPLAHRAHSRNLHNIWTHYTSSDSAGVRLSHDNIRTIYCSPSGIIWIGTRGGGINKFYPFDNIFTFYPHPHTQKLLFDLMSSLFITPDSTVLIGARNGIFALHKNSWRIEPVSNIAGKALPPLPIILGVYPDNHSHNIWVATRNGCYLFNTISGRRVALFYSKTKDSHPQSTQQFYKILWQSHLVPTVQISSVVQDSSGRYWFGTRGGGVYMLDSALKQIRFYRYNAERIDDSRDLINVLYKDSHDNIWAGTDDGLLLFDNTNNHLPRIYRHNPSDAYSISHNKIQSIYEDNHGYLWVGTYNGLSILNPHTQVWQRIYASDGLPSDIVNGVVGEYGSAHTVLWASTEQGLVRISMLYTDSTHLHNNPLRFEFITFNHNNGLQYSDFIPNALWRARDGILYFAQNNGILRVNTEAYKKSLSMHSPGKIVLTSFKVMGEQYLQHILYDETAPLEVQEQENVLVLEFAALNYYYSPFNQYSYFLEGFDKEWSKLSVQRQATYTNLSPGRYAFHIRAANNTGKWNAKDATFVIIVHPPWWKTWWAYLLYVILAVICFVIIIRYRDQMRTQSLKAQFQAREADIIFQKNLVLEEANNRLAGLNNELHSANSRLQRLYEEKIDIVNVVVHDLKNPVIGIQKLSHSLEALGRKLANETIETSGAVIKHTTERMYSLIQQLLRVHSLEDDNIRLSCIAMDMREVTEQFLKDWSGKEEKNLTICMLPSASANYSIMADPLAFLQILENLLSNATKASPNNGEIILRIFHADGMVCLSIQDSGQGISTQQQQALFQKFSSKAQYSVDASSTGLGLYITKKLVEAMNGTIMLENTSEKGSTFRVSFPAFSSG